jgi:hypothetical protein
MKNLPKILPSAYGGAGNANIRCKCARLCVEETEERERERERKIVLGGDCLGLKKI